MIPWPTDGPGPEYRMTRELFVSSTPHETKVGMVEDDLLAEIYLERENEYTLAGSIYKGRVTRVLPGMQSAFVDIGLERDAFLYVSDFMELEDSEDLDDVPTNRPPERYTPETPLPEQLESKIGLPPTSPNHNHRNSPKQGQRIGRRPRPASRATTVAACVAAVAVAAAAGSVCRNRSSPVRQRKRLWKLRRAMSDQNARNVPSVRSAMNVRSEVGGPNFRIEVDDQTGLPGRNGPSVLNTARRRDTSPSFCLESRSPNIRAWLRLRQHHPGSAQGLRFTNSRLSPLRKFLLTTNLSLPLHLPQSWRKRSLEFTKSLRPILRNPSITRRRLKIHPTHGIASSNVFTR